MSAGRGPVPIIPSKPPIVGETVILDEVVADVSSQLDAQAELGVQIRREHSVPDTGPTNRGLWYQIPEVTAVFADLKGSTGLNANDGARTAAYAYTYTYFIRAMTVIMERFSAGYVDIQGDGIFGLFSGPVAHFEAAACAITMKTQIERDIADRFRKSARVGLGINGGDRHRPGNAVGAASGPERNQNERGLGGQAGEYGRQAEFRGRAQSGGGVGPGVFPV